MWSMFVTLLIKGGTHTLGSIHVNIKFWGVMYFSSKIKNIIIIARTKTSAIYIYWYIFIIRAPMCRIAHLSMMLDCHLGWLLLVWHFSSKCKQISFMPFLIKLSCTIINFTNYFYSQVLVFILCRRIYHLHTVNNLKPWNIYRISIF